VDFFSLSSLKDESITTASSDYLFFLKLFVVVAIVITDKVLVFFQA